MVPSRFTRAVRPDRAGEATGDRGRAQFLLTKGVAVHTAAPSPATVEQPQSATAAHATRDPGKAR